MTSYRQVVYCIQGFIIMELGVRTKNHALVKTYLKLVNNPKQNEDSLNLAV